MKIKKYLVIGIGFILLLVIFASCHTYDYDEGLNGLLTPERRLLGTWELYEACSNADSSGCYYPRDHGNREVLEFNKHHIGNERYEYLGGYIEYQFEWKFSDSKELLSIRVKNGSDFDDWYDYYIYELDNNYLVLYYIDNNGNYSQALTYEKQ